MQPSLFSELTPGHLIRGLSLTRPCPFAFLNGPDDERKLIENRKWKPPTWMIGEYLALHASNTYSQFYRGWIAERMELPVPNRLEARKSEIFAICRLIGYTANILDQRISFKQRKWFLGPYGWLLDELTALARPVPTTGGQKLWRLESRPGVLDALKNSYFETTGEVLKVGIQESEIIESTLSDDRSSVRRVA